VLPKVTIVSAVPHTDVFRETKLFWSNIFVVMLACDIFFYLLYFMLLYLIGWWNIYSFHVNLTVIFIG